MKIKAGDVRRGHILQHNGNKFEVVEVTNITPGRRAAIVHIEMFNILTHTKGEMRCSPDDDVEQISIYNTPHIYSYDNGKDFIFMNTKTYDEVIIPHQQLEESKRKFLLPEQEISLGLDEEGNFVHVVWPQKVTVTVKSAPPTQKHASSDDRKRVILDNGVGIVVPGYIKEGDSIIINLNNLEFVSRKQ